MGRVLITGAGGYVGYRIARRFLERTDRELILWMRSGGREAFERRQAEWRKRFGAHAERVIFRPGDLRDEDPFGSIDASDAAQIGAIVHSAANTRFDIDEKTAEQVNIRGTRKALELARRCPNLQAVGLVSTVYSSGLHQGAVPESPLSSTSGFANHYERSKWSAENVLVTEFDDLPWRVLRTATILADDDSGVVSQYNVIHKVLRLMYRGLLPIFPGLKALPIYFVTGDFIADGVIRGMQSPESRRIYNIAPVRGEACTLEQWLTWSYDFFLEDPSFSQKRFLRPMFTDLSSFRCLARSVETFSRDVVMQAVVQLVSPFAEQMFSVKEIVNDRTRGELPHYVMPDFKALLGRVCAYLVRSEWGSHEIRDGLPTTGLRWEV